MAKTAERGVSAAPSKPTRCSKSNKVKAKPRAKFFHCYLLQSQDPKHKRSTYIGFTVDPARRIRQHNGGINGGAYRTKRKRPWDMVAIVHGFPSKSSALQFEQAWQHPQRSRHIKAKVRDLPVDSRRTVGVPGKLRLCKAMLCLDPWTRYGLGVRFLREEHATCYARLRLPSPLPPDGDADTDLSIGAQAGLPIYSSPSPDSQEYKLGALLRQPGSVKCPLCIEPFQDGATLMPCYHCGVAVHVRCLADRMLIREAEDGRDEPYEVIPLEGTCWEPACAQRLVWSRLVKRVQVYRRSGTAPAESNRLHRGILGDSNDVVAEEVGGDPPVWRVDDSSSDDDDEEEEVGGDGGRGDDSDGGEDGWSSGGAWRDLVSQDLASQTDPQVGEDKEDDHEDDDFWRLSNGSDRRSEEKLADDSGHLRRMPPRAEQSDMGNRSEAYPAVAGGPTARVSLMGATSETYYSDDSGGGEQDMDGMRSQDNLPLAERIRLRRLR